MDSMDYLRNRRTKLRSAIEIWQRGSASGPRWVGGGPDRIAVMFKPLTFC